MLEISICQVFEYVIFAFFTIFNKSLIREWKEKWLGNKSISQSLENNSELKEVNSSSDNW